MDIGDKVKVKSEFKKMLVGMPEFSKVGLEKIMTVVGFEYPKVLVEENSCKWRISWLELVNPEQESKKSKSKKSKPKRR